MRQRAAGQLREPPGRGDQPGKHARPHHRIVPVDQDAGEAVPDRGAQPADGGGDHRGPAGLSLERHQAERLRVRRHQHHGRGPVPVGQLGLRARRLVPDGAGDAELGREAVQAAGGADLRPARPAHEDHHQLVGQRRGGPQQLGRGAQHDVGTLQRLDPAGEDQHHRVGGQAEPTARGTGRAGPEHRQVHARADRLHLPGPGAVQLDQLARLFCGVGDQPVGGRHDLALAADPDRGLGAVTAGQGQVLDLAQGVHGLDEGDPPPLRRDGRDLAGQPVVRVQQVVPAGREGGLGAQHPEGERADLAGQRVLVQFLERASHHVADQHARHQLHGGRRVAADGAGEDLHLDAAAGQLLGHLDHVDVEAARVTGARLVERGGVQADGRDPLGAYPPAGALHHFVHALSNPVKPPPVPSSRLSGYEDAGAASSRRERMELKGPVHRVGGRGVVGDRGAGGRERRQAAWPVRPAPGGGAHLGADPGHPDREHRPGGSGPALAAGTPVLAAERAALRRAAGQGQGQDPAGIRRRAVHAVAPLLRRAAAADRRRRSAVPGRRRQVRRPAAGGQAADRVPEGRGRAHAAVLVRRHRAGHGPRRDGPDRRARQLAARAGQAPGRDQRRRYRGAEHPDRDPARLPARRRVPAGHPGRPVPGPGCRRGSGRSGQEPGPLGGGVKGVATRINGKSDIKGCLPQGEQPSNIAR